MKLICRFPLKYCAGGTDVLQEAVSQGWIGDVLVHETAASLLVGLRIQEGNLD